MLDEESHVNNEVVASLHHFPKGRYILHQRKSRNSVWTAQKYWQGLQFVLTSMFFFFFLRSYIGLGTNKYGPSSGYIRDLACFGLGLPQDDKYYLHYTNVH